MTIDPSQEAQGFLAPGAHGTPSTGATSSPPRNTNRPEPLRAQAAGPPEADPSGGGNGGSATGTSFGAGVAGSEVGSAPSGGTDAEPRRRRSRRGGRGRGGRGRGGRRHAGDEAGAAELDGRASGERTGPDGDASDPSGDDAPATPSEERRGSGRSRRRSRRPSKRSGEGSPSEARSADEQEDEPEDEPLAGSGAEAEGADASGEAPRRRRRGSRGGRRRRKPAADEGPVAVDVIPGEDDDLSDLADPDEDSDSKPAIRSGASKRRGKRGGKRRKRGGSERGEQDEDDDEPETGRRGLRKGSGRATEIADDEENEADRVQQILVNATDPEETRVAVIEDGRIVDFHMTVARSKSFVNDIYRGRVVNLETAIGAAFVDFGQGRNGFLHASDVMSVYGEDGFKLENLLTANVDVDEVEGQVGGNDVSEELEDDDDESEGSSRGSRRKSSGRSASRRPSRRPRRQTPIKDLVKKGQMTVVQITKDAIGDKGPTLTTYISIPGRYIVLMPSLARTGVSRKIEDDKERRRLKRILQGLDIPEGMGVIVRTAGTAKTKKDLKRDLDYLLAVWENFKKRLVSGRNPMPLYEESDVAIRTMRDLFSSRTKEVIVDDPEVYEHVLEFTRKLMPEQEHRIKLHDGPRPLFHTHAVEQDFERIFARRVELPSGGSIVFDQTEALVSIDVNSGRTREKGAEFEDIALKTNLEAVPEIARQIRLRDLGGIIVADFIDMMKAGNRRAVERALRDAIAPDRARSKLGRISQFGLLELTRQRLGPGLSKLVFEACSHCRGSGRVRTAPSRAQSILRRLGSALSQKGFSTVEVRAHPETVDYLEQHYSGKLDELSQMSGRELTLTPVPDQIEDSVLRYLRADGREVRPGGRRKR